MKKIFFALLTLIFVLSCSKDDSNNSVDDVNISIPDISTNQMATGTSANDLLSDDNFTSLLIELVYVEGNAPSQNTINNFMSFLEDRLFKPDGISVETRSIVSPGTIVPKSVT